MHSIASHTIKLEDQNGKTRVFEFLIDPIDTSGVIALAEAGNEYNLKRDEFLEETVVLDCGAGYGEFSLECALKGALWIYAFEPNLTLAEYLISNTREFSNISIQKCGVWVESKDSLLYFRKTGTASASIHEVQFDPDSELGRERITEQIKLVSLGDQIAQLSIKFPLSHLALKLDVEGAEHQIIQFLADQNLLKDLHKIWIEYHYGSQEILSILSKSFSKLTVQEKGSDMGLIKAEN